MNRRGFLTSLMAVIGIKRQNPVGNDALEAWVNHKPTFNPEPNSSYFLITTTKHTLYLCRDEKRDWVWKPFEFDGWTGK